VDRAILGSPAHGSKSAMQIVSKPRSHSRRQMGTGMNFTDRVVVYRRADGDWGWKLLARNNRIIATSGEGYTRRTQARKIAVRVTGRTPDLED